MRTFFALVILGVLGVGCNAFTDTDEIPRPKCDTDADCSDGVFCNGAETCEPEAPTADGLGCVAVGAQAFLDDGIDCTTDLCDEQGAAQIHDASGCECQDDGTCEAIHSGSCVLSATCEGGVCQVTLADVGSGCDDQIPCTSDSVCDDAGTCSGVEDHTVCDDGTYCNGEERCAPTDAGADGVTGCIDGPAPVEGATVEPACAAAACDERAGEVVAVPTDACACQTAADCGDAGDCRIWRCDASTGFACADDGGVDVGTSCDDGLGCTVADTCDAQGTCVGAVAHPLCDDDDLCNGAEVCSPTEGCTPGVAPDPLPMECE
jgi:hypothetical protein